MIFLEGDHSSSSYDRNNSSEKSSQKTNDYFYRKFQNRSKNANYKIFLTFKDDEMERQYVKFHWLTTLFTVRNKKVKLAVRVILLFFILIAGKTMTVLGMHTIGQVCTIISIAGAIFGTFLSLLMGIHEAFIYVNEVYMMVLVVYTELFHYIIPYYGPTWEKAFYFPFNVNALVFVITHLLLRPRVVFLIPFMIVDIFLMLVVRMVFTVIFNESYDLMILGTIGNVLIYIVTLLCVLLMEQGSREHFLLNAELKKKKQELRRELNKSKQLLYNIFPTDFVELIKEKNYLGECHIESEKYENSVVLQTDLKDFTRFSERSTPGKVISVLNAIYKNYDHYCVELGCSKIKTIGDGYILFKENNPDDVILFGLLCMKIRDHLKYIIEWDYDLRVGIDSGPCFFTIYGTKGEGDVYKNLNFDVYGAAIEKVDHLEQNSPLSSVHVSWNIFKKTVNQFSYTVEKKKNGMEESYVLGEECKIHDSLLIRKFRNLVNSIEGFNRKTTIRNGGGNELIKYGLERARSMMKKEECHDKTEGDDEGDLWKRTLKKNSKNKSVNGLSLGNLNTSVEYLDEYQIQEENIVSSSFVEKNEKKKKSMDKLLSNQDSMKKKPKGFKERIKKMLSTENGLYPYLFIFKERKVEAQYKKFVYKQANTDIFVQISMILICSIIVIFFMMEKEENNGDYFLYTSPFCYFLYTLVIFNFFVLLVSLLYYNYKGKRTFYFSTFSILFSFILVFCMCISLFFLPKFAVIALFNLLTVNTVVWLGMTTSFHFFWRMAGGIFVCVVILINFFHSDLDCDEKLDLVKKTLNSAVGVIGGITIDWFYRQLYDTYLRAGAQNKVLEVEKRRNDNLVVSVLPKFFLNKILKSNGGKSFDELEGLVVFMKINLCSFVDDSEEQSIRFIIKLFNRFFEICERYECLKIKSFGSSFIFVSLKNIGYEISKRKKRKRKKAEDPFNPGFSYLIRGLRSSLMCMKEFKKLVSREVVGLGLEKDSTPYIQIGINQGRFSAGIVGTEKYLFDIFGSCINISARCCQNTYRNTIQTTERVFFLAETETGFEEMRFVKRRDIVDLKGVNKTQNTYFLNDRNDRLSFNEELFEVEE